MTQPKQDLEKMAEEIFKCIGGPIAFDNHYRITEELRAKLLKDVESALRRVRKETWEEAGDYCRDTVLKCYENCPTHQEYETECEDCGDIAACIAAYFDEKAKEENGY